MKKLSIAYIRDMGVLLGISHRDSRGRFTKNNPYRFRRTNIAISGESYPFLAQCPLRGSYLKGIKS